jgi:hypothetical protein
MAFMASVRLLDLLPPEAVDHLYEVFKAHFDQPDLHEAMTAALLPYKETVEKSGFTTEQVAKAVADTIMRVALRASRPKPQLPLRVDVWNGDQSVHLGPGTYVADVPVYFFLMDDGSLRSCENAEREPYDWEVPPGATVQKSPNNPKIVLDSGRTVYGCQVWWSPLEA